MNKNKINKSAFTLIELLIVVAIIAILAAIALPNFLEAQIRAKVSRAKADMSAIVTGINMYQVDNNKSPSGTDTPEQLFKITTPIAYMTSIPQDVFFKGPQEPFYDLHGPFYRFWILTEILEINPIWGGQELLDKQQQGNNWLLLSRGPDLEERIDVTNIVDYDPTNGTISMGDINKWGS